MKLLFFYVLFFHFILIVSKMKWKPAEVKNEPTISQKESKNKRAIKVQIWPGQFEMIYIETTWNIFTNAGFWMEH